MQTQVARDWLSQSACRDVDPELFFPAAEPGSSVYERQVAEAKTVCAACPVRALCLEFAFDALPHGIAGGLTEDERRSARARARRRAAAPAPAAAVVDDGAPAPDPALVERLARHGRAKGPVSAGERRALRAAALLMAEAGASVPAIAERLQVTERTVERWFTAARRAAEGGAAA
jgi:hypothetical protein